MRLWTALAFVLWAGVALAQNTFPSPGGQTVQGRVVMQITAGKAVPRSGTPGPGPDAQFPTPGGATVGSVVWMCVNAGVATPCPAGGGGGSTSIPTANDVSANWGKAGLTVIGGIPSGRTQCGSTVNPSGLTPPTAGDDASLINAAITACTSGHFVQLGSGTFQLDLSEQVTINRDGVTLRGTGNCTNGSSPYCQTVIQYYNGAWPTYNPPNYCGATTGTPPSGTAPGAFVACPNGGNALVAVGPPFPGSFLGWGATSGSTNCQVGSANPTTAPCGTLLTADASKGDITVHVTSTSNFAPGDWVYIEDNPLYTTQTNPLFAQYVSGGAPSTTVSATPDLFSTSLTPVTPRTENVDLNCSYSMCTARLNGEIKLITAVGAGTLTFDSPLTMDKRISNSHDGRVYWLTGCGCGSGPTPPTKVAFLQQAGIENITLSRAGNGTGPLYFQFCAYCYAQNVETSYWIGGVVVSYSGRVQLSRNFFHDTNDAQNNGNEYPVSIQSGSSEILVENNIVVLGGKGMVARASSSAVIAYNYVDKTFYQQQSIGNWFLDMDLNCSHAGNAHHCLFEGNWASNCDGDQTHGAAAFHTFFRNQCTGLRSDFNDPSNPSLHVSDANNQCYCGAGSCGAGVPNSCGRLRAVGPMSYNYGYSFVGNVLGLAGVTTTGNGWIYSSRTPGNRGTGGTHPMTGKSMWQSGWTGQDPATCCEYVSDPWLDGTNTPQLLFQNCNYDYVTGTVPDCAGGIYTSTLPNSLYLSSRPAFFTGTSCTYPWPWVTPQSGSPLQSVTGPGGCSTLSPLPAKARYEAGTPFQQQ